MIVVDSTVERKKQKLANEVSFLFAELTPSILKCI
jgi:hypothetical protein